MVLGLSYEPGLALSIVCVSQILLWFWLLICTHELLLLSLLVHLFSFSNWNSFNRLLAANNVLYMK